jgi:hypothetical protein
VLDGECVKHIIEQTVDIMARKKKEEERGHDHTMPSRVHLMT